MTCHSETWEVRGGKAGASRPFVCYDLALKGSSENPLMVVLRPSKFSPPRLIECSLKPCGAAAACKPVTAVLTIFPVSPEPPSW